MPHYFYGGIMKRILQINIIALMMLLFLSPVNALNDGAYLISRSTSYVNPLTGKTEDGRDFKLGGFRFEGDNPYRLMFSKYGKDFENIISL